MRILKATNKTQGQKPTDFFWTDEGEILRLSFVQCDNDQTTTGKRCGCRESSVGVSTLKGTTTFIVDDAPIDEQGLRLILAGSYAQAGFGGNQDALMEAVEDSVATHRLAELIPPGTVCDLVDHILSVRAIV